MTQQSHTDAAKMHTEAADHHTSAATKYGAGNNEDARKDSEKDPINH